MLVATEEATTTKFNKALVTDKGMMAEFWLSAILAPDLNNLCGVMRTHSPAQKGHTNKWAIGCLQSTETLPAFSCLHP